MADPIRIVCDDQSHAPKVARIARMVEPHRGWRDMGSTTRAAKREADERAAATGMALGLPKRTQSGYRPQLDEGDNHEKFTFKCPLCGYDVQVRAETLKPILDTLSSAAVSSISLRALDARVGK